MDPRQKYTPLSGEEYRNIKPGDVIERMLAFSIPCYLVVHSVDEKYIHTSEEPDAGWKFDRNTGLEIDEMIPATVSYIRRILTEEQKSIVATGRKLSDPTGN